MRPFIPKDHPDIPDHYGVTVCFLSGGEKVYEIARHRFIDKVLHFDGNGRITAWEPHQVPFLELELKENEYLCIPLSSTAWFRFDKRWSKVREIKRELREKEQSERKRANEEKNG